MSSDPVVSAQVEAIMTPVMELVREIRSGRLELALTIAHGWALDETNHSEGGGSKNGHSDPTSSRLAMAVRTFSMEYRCSGKLGPRRRNLSIQAPAAPSIAPRWPKKGSWMPMCA